jgi:hypothetical protein
MLFSDPFGLEHHAENYGKKLKEAFVWVYGSIQCVKKIHCHAVVHFEMH